MTWTRIIVEGFASIGKGMADIFGSISIGLTAKCEPESTLESLEADSQSIANDWRSIRQDLSDTTEEFRQSMRQSMKGERHENNIGNRSQY